MSKPSSPTPSSTTSSSSPDVINKAATKLCHIIKRPDFDGYGFNLHSEKAKPGQFIGKVDANSPAEAAGLKEGDRIIEVNGTAINSESHKQVVQRIKAISCEVRLLLVDVDGKGDGKMLFNGSPSNGMDSPTKTEQVLPGASDNINSITMVSTKRPSQESQRSPIAVTPPTVPLAAAAATNGNNGMDVTDKAISSNDHHHQQMMMNNNNNTPPPPSATMATVNKTPATMMMNNTSSSNNNNNNITSNTSNGNTLTETTSKTTTTMSSSASSSTSTSNSMTTGSGNGTMKAGSLNLTMTAAEMRAKLAMKKKYDPKNESVDLKKKYEIVQKL